MKRITGTVVIRTVASFLAPMEFARFEASAKTTKDVLDPMRDSMKPFFILCILGKEPIALFANKNYSWDLVEFLNKQPWPPWSLYAVLLKYQGAVVYGETGKCRSLCAACDTCPECGLNEEDAKELSPCLLPSMKIDHRAYVVSLLQTIDPKDEESVMRLQKFASDEKEFSRIRAECIAFNKQLLWHFAKRGIQWTNKELE